MCVFCCATTTSPARDSREKTSSHWSNSEPCSTTLDLLALIPLPLWSSSSASTWSPRVRGSTAFSRPARPKSCWQILPSRHSWFALVLLNVVASQSRNEEARSRPPRESTTPAAVQVSLPSIPANCSIFEFNTSLSAPTLSSTGTPTRLFPLSSSGSVKPWGCGSRVQEVPLSDSPRVRPMLSSYLDIWMNKTLILVILNKSREREREREREQKVSLLSFWLFSWSWKKPCEFIRTCSG